MSGVRRARESGSRYQQQDLSVVFVTDGPSGGDPSTNQVSIHTTRSSAAWLASYPARSTSCSRLCCGGERLRWPANLTLTNSFLLSLFWVGRHFELKRVMVFTHVGQRLVKVGCHTSPDQATSFDLHFDERGGVHAQEMEEVSPENTRLAEFAAAACSDQDKQVATEGLVEYGWKPGDQVRFESGPYKGSEATIENGVVLHASGDSEPYDANHGVGPSTIYFTLPSVDESQNAFCEFVEPVLRALDAVRQHVGKGVITLDNNTMGDDGTIVLRISVCCPDPGVPFSFSLTVGPHDGADIRYIKADGNDIYLEKYHDNVRQAIDRAKAIVPTNENFDLHAIKRGIARHEYGHDSHAVHQRALQYKAKYEAFELIVTLIAKIANNVTLDKKRPEFLLLDTMNLDAFLSFFECLKREARADVGNRKLLFSVYNRALAHLHSDHIVKGAMAVGVEEIRRHIAGWLPFPQQHG